MLRWLLLALTLPFIALSLLAFVRAPAWSPWKLGVLVGEYGHWLLFAPLALGLVAWFTRGPALAPTVATTLAAALAVGLLASPLVEAWKLSRALPARLTRAFGPVALPRTPFALGKLLAATPAPVAVETHVYAPGLSLDYYRPVRSAATAAPCVILIHGGGWDGGDRTEIAHFNHWLARCGYAVAAIDYRLAPAHRWPAPREDVLAALAFLRTRATSLGLDPARFVLCGRSAGGQIAQTVAYTAGDPSIRGVISLYAPSDLIFGYVNTTEDDMLRSPTLMRQYLGGSPDTARDAYESASALFHVSATVPPTLLLHGTTDALVWYRHSVRLAARLAEVRAPHVYLALPWATHAFEYNLNGPGGQLTRFSVEWFLAAVTK